ncbi:unnamed protein product [Schistosoma margrebowiei]|uniref:Uncharacterized protein n=1 Tax=Schistosoma margrebowiei TaxID=48269 RepID=A0AA85APW6_9TREM|nr:unnamed protein product [Schistosoma margrebowiei]
MNNTYKSFQYSIEFIVPLVLSIVGIICLIVALILIWYYRRKRNKQDTNSSTYISTNQTKQLQLNGKKGSERKFKIGEILNSSKQFPSYPVTAQIPLSSSNLTSSQSSSLSPSVYPIAGIVAKSVNPRNPTQPPLPSLQTRKTFKE